jgi:hypothetical protein
VTVPGLRSEAAPFPSPEGASKTGLLCGAARCFPQSYSRTSRPVAPRAEGPPVAPLQDLAPLDEGTAPEIRRDPRTSASTPGAPSLQAGPVRPIMTP